MALVVDPTVSVAQSNPTAALADELAAFLEEHGPQSGDAVARGVRRLRTKVLHTLREDERFVRSGRGRATRWHVRQDADRNGNETGYLAMNGAGATPESSASSWSWERSSSLCVDPVLHRGFGAHYEVDGERCCIRCDGPPVAPPLTLEEWMAGEGGEDRRQLFENDWLAVETKTATPEQIERFRYGISATDKAIDAVAGVS